MFRCVAMLGRIKGLLGPRGRGRPPGARGPLLLVSSPHTPRERFPALGRSVGGPASAPCGLDPCGRGDGVRQGMSFIKGGLPGAPVLYAERCPWAPGSHMRKYDKDAYALTRGVGGAPRCPGCEHHSGSSMPLYRCAPWWLCLRACRSRV